MNELADLSVLQVEVGEPVNGLARLRYERQGDQWLLTEQVYVDGWATSEEVVTAVPPPEVDLPARIRAWAGPVAIQVDERFARAVRVMFEPHPDLNRSSFDINGSSWPESD